MWSLIAIQFRTYTKSCHFILGSDVLPCGMCAHRHIIMLSRPAQSVAHSTYGQHRGSVVDIVKKHTNHSHIFKPEEYGGHKPVHTTTARHTVSKSPVTSGRTRTWRPVCRRR